MRHAGAQPAPSVRARQGRGPGRYAPRMVSSDRLPGMAAGNGLRPAVATLLGFALACGSGHTDPPSPPSGPEADACGHYYDVVYGGSCGGAALPAAESTRQRARFVQACANQFALPGSTVTAADVSSCADALGADGCRNETTPTACLLIGTLVIGQRCNNGSQCESGACSGPVDGCGTCSGSIPDGQSCAQGTPNGCGPRSLCDTSMPNWRCIPAPNLDVGAACALPNECKAGLSCRGTCARPSAAGGSCTTFTDCAYPLFCNSKLKCQTPGPAGSTCAYDNECVQGLACDTSSMTCNPVTWVGAGHTCNSVTRCLVGDCPSGGGACPMVIADGQSCATTDPSQTCDVSAVCFLGRCMLKDGGVCR
jgi:hypothetical protein